MMWTNHNLVTYLSTCLLYISNNMSLLRDSGADTYAHFPYLRRQYAIITTYKTIIYINIRILYFYYTHILLLNLSLQITRFYTSFSRQWNEMCRSRSCCELYHRALCDHSKLASFGNRMLTYACDIFAHKCMHHHNSIITSQHMWLINSQFFTLGIMPVMYSYTLYVRENVRTSSCYAAYYAITFKDD